MASHEVQLSSEEIKTNEEYHCQELNVSTSIPDSLSKELSAVTPGLAAIRGAEQDSAREDNSVERGIEPERSR